MAGHAIILNHGPTPMIIYLVSHRQDDEAYRQRCQAARAAAGHIHGYSWYASTQGIVNTLTTSPLLS
jgi:hypothetical protein